MFYKGKLIVDPKFYGIKIPTMYLYNQFINSNKTDPRVRAMAMELGLQAHLMGKFLEITGIFRTREKNIEIYGRDKASGHREMPVRAIDFSLKDLDIEDIAHLKNHFAMFLDNGSYWSFISHDVGAGAHLHLQAPHADYNKILWEEV